MINFSVTTLLKLIKEFILIFQQWRGQQTLYCRNWNSGRFQPYYCVFAKWKISNYNGLFISRNSELLTWSGQTGLGDHWLRKGKKGKANWRRANFLSSIPNFDFKRKVFKTTFNLRCLFNIVHSRENLTIIIYFKKRLSDVLHRKLSPERICLSMA